MILDHIYEAIIDNVFLRLDDLVPGSEVFLKLEGLNPAGSIKLKAALGMVEDAERAGIAGPGDRIIESSSGSLGVALALVAAAKGHPFTCVTDPNTSPHSVALMRALGAEVVEVSRRDANGGFLGTRIAYIRERVAAEPDVVWLNQYANPANPRAHEIYTARAILSEIVRIDYLFVGVGTSGTLMGCLTHFRKHSPATRIVAVDSEGSVTFGFPPKPRYIPGLGTSRKPEICCPDAPDEVILISEADAVRTCRSFAQRGVFVGGSTGSVLAAVAHAAPKIPEGSRVVALSPDFGDRYTHTVYNDDWVTRKFGPETVSIGELAGQTGR